MKVQIKNLKPNPFRDMDNYPIMQDKVQSLINSINQTGFWDNILARKNNGNIEIAYGHHRLVVLRKLFKPDDYVDIPVRELDDSTMIRIMANENDESWGTSPKIIDETIGVVRKYILSDHVQTYIKTKNPIRGKDYFYSIEAFQISEFLNGNWVESRVNFSLERIKAEETEETHEQHIDKEAVEMYPTERSARNFVKAVKQIKNITPEQQRNVAKRMIEKESFGELVIKSELLDEKYRGKKKKEDKEEKHILELKFMMIECTNIMKKLNSKFTILYDYQTEHNLNFNEYKDLPEAQYFRNQMLTLMSKLRQFAKRGGEQNDKREIK